MNNRTVGAIDDTALEEQRRFASLVFDINEAYFSQTGRHRLALTHSYGCQQNVADGEKLNGQLAEMGYGFTDNADEADIIIYNTCAVREHAEDRVYGNLGALKHNKRRKPNMLIGVCGCMTQQEHVAEKIKKSYPYVDMVFGTYAIHKLPEMVYGTLLNRKRVFDLEERQNYITEGLPVRHDGTLKAWLPVMYGCNNFCTYCIVPYVRGRERSRSSETIIAEAKQLVESGFKEIMLLGQNVNSYGNTTPGELSFAELLKRINAIEGDFRIKFMTSHPKDATAELFNAIAQSEKVERHIHLPVQCGSNRILKLMNRGYTAEKYLETIELARQTIKDAAFTSDIIVGFPGETYEDFKETLALLDKVRYDALFTFIYSSRQGTRAAEMEDPVPYKDKTEWFAELLKVQSKIAVEQYQKKIGSVVRVLAEAKGKTEGSLSGKTEHGTTCEFPAHEQLLGSFVNVKVTDAQNWSLVGEIQQ
ncbi:tRNA (N6-isopentenyl adenosine(37)-C2)-methylthiotransferase MiaB [Acetanaerobacterium elongatum]|uniref:tRNA-2-methylthio-N(6)-dimethylallyladenosine synthase n=1 Tax=Acetanaerobacterium elongatum TaxID=258515 RepID=A0A1G9X3B9_9FIRM|nr:tRNA (N6-isopentenyl adenosine(37)-C2)-methylthiotransferase MiaB [Acetanaerobacterium elongatum]SDM91182.1 tRNA-2-methylthio-N6-dimethylallyladenosine synthase [Acetanaerobacterium elongatum]